MDIFGTIAATIAKAIASIVVLVFVLITGKQLAGPLPLQSDFASTSAATNFPVASSTHTVATTSATTKTVAKNATKLATTTAPAAPAQQPVQALGTDTLNSIARASIVNILCTTAAGGTFRPISGSGVMVDSRGVVLTNAHVAQFFLLRNYSRPNNIDCVVRTGSPAVNTYRAELLYLPMQWITDNAQEITATQASGTGENDFAFLRITGPYNPANTVSDSLPHLAMKTSAPDVGDHMFLAAYPAGFLSGELIATQLYASTAYAYVTQLFTFTDGTNNVDLFSIGGSIESQAGSSGGAVLREDGSLAGIISTAILQGSTGERDLRAISVGFINRALAAFGQGGVTQLLSGDLAAKAADFNATTAPKETAKLEAVLDAANR